MRAILHDRRSQLAIGLFIGTFAYSMTVLREVNGKSSGGGPLPGLAVVVDYGLILSSTVVLVLYVHHTAQSIRVGGLIGWVADETRDEVDRLYPASPKPEDDPSVVVAPDYGIVTRVPHLLLVDIAEKAECVLELVPAMGDFVPRGGPLFHVVGSLPEPHRSRTALSARLPAVLEIVAHFCGPVASARCLSWTRAPVHGTIRAGNARSIERSGPAGGSRVRDEARRQPAGRRGGGRRGPRVPRRGGHR